MNKSKSIHPILSTVFIFLTLEVTQASVLTLIPSGKSIENVPIAKSATVRIEDRSLEITTTGAGVRTKKVAIVKVKVYVAQLMVADANHFVRTPDGALDSLAVMKGAAIRLDFLRSVDAQTVQSSFRDALIANQVNLNNAPIRELLEAISRGGDATEGKALVIVGEKLQNGSEAVTYEDTAGTLTTLTGPEGFIREVFSIWLGKPADAGIETLKQALMGGV